MDDRLVIAVASGKGGTGKTTVATNLASTAGFGHRASKRPGIKTRYRGRQGRNYILLPGSRRKSKRFAAKNSVCQ